ncbi:Aste57867_12443 [Aphanomyces stellatus]|uniref:Aste57867_12443 protein n=1 Tax=Aphanomyces stellatus TaxID=120398 RepID=A0A485KVJ1_9STRA|nr:hypothetical protein As57867_012397 [Aphanomyces stellatus]VFT89294.1 Aste57867_12443 [Aphanomyces stellatus]
MTTWVDTPAVVVDEARLQRNIDEMQARATAHGLNLRPHAKTHKSVEIANRALAAGAIGLTVSKPLEARKFMEAGFRDITLAYPVVDRKKLDLTIACAKRLDVAFNLTVDSVFGVNVAVASAATLDFVLNILVHIDVGYHRVGIEEHDPRLRQVVTCIQQSPSLKLIGILSHSGQCDGNTTATNRRVGHSYGAKSREECEAIAESERLIMLRVKAAIEAMGSPISVVSVGSTPTELCRVNYDGLTELRPGNYVFQDRTPVRTGVSDVQHVALSVVATVVSANASYFIIDAGSKVLSSDTARGDGPFGSHCYGLVFRETDFDHVTAEPTAHEWTDPVSGHRGVCFEIKKLSEEHGWVAHAPGLASPQIGDRVTVLVNHACPIVNLCNGLSLKGSTPRYIDLLSRGCSQ